MAAAIGRTQRSGAGNVNRVSFAATTSGVRTITVTWRGYANNL